MRKVLVLTLAVVALVGFPALASAQQPYPPGPPFQPPGPPPEVPPGPPPGVPPGPPTVAPGVVTPPGPPPAVQPAPIETVVLPGEIRPDPAPGILQRALPVTGTDLLLPALLLAGLLLAAGSGMLAGARRRLATIPV